MLCLRCSRGLTALSTSSIVTRTLQQSSLKIPSARTFTSLTTLRPTLSTPFRSSLTVSQPKVNATVDLLPKISTHPALGGIQVRCGPRDTFSPSHFVRKRRHGFLSRLRTRKGRATLQRRRAKKRSTLSH